MSKSTFCNNVTIQAKSNPSTEKTKYTDHKVSTKHTIDLWMESIGLHYITLIFPLNYWRGSWGSQRLGYKQTWGEVNQCLTLKPCGKKTLKKMPGTAFGYSETSIFEWNISRFACKRAIFRRALLLESLWWNITNANMCATFVWSSMSGMNSLENRRFAKTNTIRFLSLCALHVRVSGGFLSGELIAVT